MCGRYVRRLDLAIYAEQFGFLIETPTPPAYNIACTNLADVVRVREGVRRHAPVPWGFLPVWAKDAKSRTINARSETVHELRMFRNAFEKRRCLILADGIIEWQTIGKRKLPYLFTLKGDQPFAFAGIWNRTRVGAESVESCAILTTAANELFARIHDRMPVILQKDAIASWLDTDKEDASVLREFLVPYPAEEMASIAISPKVNSARYKEADCLEPTAAASEDLFAES
ncbi:MAG: SOS response-associated peptidase [Planctomycetes bacterium]|nr:SOS response-associated peptidase [Planctomycetota bacterium]